MEPLDNDASSPKQGFPFETLSLVGGFVAIMFLEKDLIAFDNAKIPFLLHIKIFLNRQKNFMKYSAVAKVQLSSCTILYMVPRAL